MSRYRSLDEAIVVFVSVVASSVFFKVTHFLMVLA